jgi:Domain of unknown function (DUF4919)
MSRIAAITALIAIAIADDRAFAQGKPASHKELLGRARQGDLSMDFRAFRFACLKDEKCDARGDRDTMTTMRRAMQAKNFAEAAKMADALIEQGFINIEAHATAARAYESLDKPDKAKFHGDVARGLIQSIFQSGDGKTKETAFVVIGAFEEYITLQLVGLPPFGSQSLIPGKPHSYDVQTVTDPKTGSKVAVYFNIDAFYPMKF